MTTQAQALKKLEWTLRQIAQLDPEIYTVGTARFMANQALAAIATVSREAQPVAYVLEPIGRLSKLVDRQLHFDLPVSGPDWRVIPLVLVPIDSPAPDVRPSAQPQDSPTYLGKQCQQERRDARLPYSRICDICGFGLCIRTAQPVQDKPQGWDAEFLSKRLARVAKAVGVPMPDMSHEDTAAVAGTILGTIAGKLEQAAPAVPDGWKPVPLDPTDEMMQAAWDKANELWNTPESDDPLPGHQYRAMLAAAPSAPSVSAAQPASLEKQNADLLLALQKIARRASVHPDDDAEDHKRNLHHCEAIAIAAISPHSAQPEEMTGGKKAKIELTPEQEKRFEEILPSLGAKTDIERLGVRLAVKINMEKCGLIDYQPAARFARELHAAIAAPVQQEVDQDAEYSEGQWWHQELLKAASHPDASLDLKRAVIGVIPKMIRELNSSMAAQEAPAVPRERFDELLKAEHALSDSYVRLREILGAMNPPSTAPEALYAYVEQRAQEVMAAPAVPELSDAEIVKVLASLGIDSTPSIYGFDALQVGTTVPMMRKIVAAYLAAAPSAPSVLDGYVLMPRELTATNGAKAALIGEFSEAVELTCPECADAGEEACTGCPMCDGDGWVSQPVMVGWDTIKNIYRKAVEVCAAPSAPSVIAVDRTAIREAIAEALGDAYDCIRVWSAWGYGTMGPDDFLLVAEDEARLDEITDAVIASMHTPTTTRFAPSAPAQEKDTARLDWMAAEGCQVESLTLRSGTRYRICWPDIYEAQGDWFDTPRAAIDAAIAAPSAPPVIADKPDNH